MPGKFKVQIWFSYLQGKLEAELDLIAALPIT